ncbi:hypothetical protein CYMTET_46102 [Cymbomonas tetramitiformis]|uniref:Uncharacterized protein n=1 Tax=Cymbomonas tetramitiformis TaxID=36881 RepID=A0AAE0BWV7_9CHLO|nr:hypothetical protein CYMTET_46102 [Cymbomonas tetramitiformis]
MPLSVLPSDSRVHTKRQRRASFGETAAYTGTRQDDADIALARAFYSAGISHNALNNKHVKEALQKVALVGSVYKPLTYNAVGGLLPPPNDFILNEKARVPDLKPVFVRSCGQVAGACAAERAHKVMNFVRSEGRNRLGNAKMNNLVYINWNLRQLDNVEHLEYNGPKVIAWTEGQDDTCASWVDAWRDANADANAEAFTDPTRRTRAVTRAERVATAAASRLAPTLGPDTEESEPEDVDEQAEGEAPSAPTRGGATTRSGRAIRRPGSLLSFYGE